jgi:glutamine---fructose-6-phosphate transaminase (isomerizing)
MNVTSHIKTVQSDEPSAYLSDVLAQPEALAALLDTMPAITSVARDARFASRPRVIVSGMGSSHLAGFGIWAALVRSGVAAWWIDTAQLLDAADDLIVPGTLLWLTSQSGGSAETVALLDRGLPADVDVIGITNNTASRLASAAGAAIDLRAGDEATVSTKSYVNSLAVARVVAASIAGDLDAERARLLASVEAMATYLAGLDAHVAAMDDFAVGRHLVLTGRGQAVMSAEAAGLILKEAAKATVEGLSAGALRHGPIELAGPRLAVLFFDHGAGAHRDQNLRLARDLAAAGTEVASVAADALEGLRPIPAPAGEGIDPGIRDALAFQALSFQLARRNGVAAGAFRFASKVTDIL